MPEARQEFREKDTGAEAECQKKEIILGKKIRDQKGSAMNKKEFRGTEMGAEAKRKEQGNNCKEKRRESKQGARSQERI